MARPNRHLRAISAPAADDLDALLRQVARGDRNAYAQLFDLQAPVVLGLCQRVLRDRAQAEEVAQEVLLEIWRKAPEWQLDSRSAQAWVAMVAHRRAVDRVRSEQASRDRQDRDHRRAPAPPPDPVADEAAATLEQDRVRRALATLTNAQRQSVELAYYEGHTHREVAELLDLPLGTVKTRIRDGLIRLRDTLDTRREEP